MLRTYAYPVRLIALFMAMLAMLMVTIALPNAADAQTSGDVVIPNVSGKVLNENGKVRGTFAG